MNAELQFTEEQQLLQEPVAVPHVSKIKSTNVKMLLFFISLFAFGVMTTSAAETDISYLLICYNEGVSSDACFQNPHVGSIASSMTIYANAIQAIGGIVVAPFLSTKSDTLGRKKIVILFTFLNLVSQILKWWLVFGTQSTPHYYWLLLPSIIETLGGGIPMISPMAISFITDTIVDPKDRAQYISYIDGSLLIAVALGPTIGSAYIEAFGIEQLYFASIALLALVVLCCCLVLKESLSSLQAELNRSKESHSYVGNYKIVFYNHIKEPDRQRVARLFTACAIVGPEFVLSFMNVLYLYVKRRFNWTAVATGYLISATSAERVFACLVGFPFLFKKFAQWWGTHPKDIDRVDLTMQRISLGFCASGYLAIALAKTPSTFMLASMFEGLASFGSPINKSALVKYAPEGQVGAFMGVVSFLCSILGLVFPTALLKVYSATVDVWPGLAFIIVSTGFMGLLALSFSINAKR